MSHLTLKEVANALNSHNIAEIMSICREYASKMTKYLHIEGEIQSHDLGIANAKMQTRNGESITNATPSRSELQKTRTLVLLQAFNQGNCMFGNRVTFLRELKCLQNWKTRSGTFWTQSKAQLRCTSMKEDLRSYKRLCSDLTYFMRKSFTTDLKRLYISLCRRNKTKTRHMNGATPSRLSL